VIVPVAAATLGLLALRPSSVDRIGDYGLIQAVTGGYLAALALVSVCFVVYLRLAPRAPRLGLLFVAALVALLDGAPMVIEGEPRFPVTYVHAGFAEAIMRTGETLPMLDARFSWPGFFSLFAYLSDAAGLPDTMPLAFVFPFLIKGLWLAAMWIVLRRLFDDVAVCWLGLWIFELVDWSSQSYYSPQALGVFTYLVCLSVLVVALDPATRPGPGSRNALVVVIVSFAALVASHQLTPFMIISAAASLAALRLTRARSLWLLFVVMFVVWFSFATATYWVGHIEGLLGDAGNVSRNLDDNVGGRLEGNPAHQEVIYARMAISAVPVLLAGLGIVLTWRRRVFDLRVVVLAAAPAATILLQSYGGEGLIRIFLFMLPLLAGASAYALLAPRGRVGSVVASALLALLLVALGPLSVVTKYGSESFESVTPSERHAAAWVHARVRPGDLVASIAPAGWLRERRVGQVDFAPALDRFQTGDLKSVRSLMTSHEGQRFLVLSESQYAYGNQVSGLPKGWQVQLLADLDRARDFRLVYREGTTRVYMVLGSEGADDATS
jgi:hypothetical protein